MDDCGDPKAAFSRRHVSFLKTPFTCIWLQTRKLYCQEQKKVLSSQYFYLKSKVPQIVFSSTGLGDSALILRLLARWMGLKYSFKLLTVNHFYIVVTFSMSPSIADSWSLQILIPLTCITQLSSVYKKNLKIHKLMTGKNGFLKGSFI